MLNILPGRLQTNRVVPLGVDRCRVEFDFYYAPDDRRSATRDARPTSPSATKCSTKTSTICEDVQRGLASRLLRAGPAESAARERACTTSTNCCAPPIAHGDAP